jgi:HPt (histidine-containing phosphotransfer) domain-containing protein
VGAIERNVRDGKGSPALDNVAYPCALGTARFADLAPADRRRLLMTVTGVRPTQDLVRAKLTERGHHKDRVEAILPMLRSGWDAAEADAGRRATEARGAWKAITGEAYGDKKAEGWEAPIPDGFDPDAAAATKIQIEELEAGRAKLFEERGQQKERELRAQKFADMRDLASRVPALEAEMDALEAELAEVKETHAAILKSRAIDEAHANPQACPACGVALVVGADGTLRERPKKKPRSASSSEALVDALQNVDARMESLYDKLGTVSASLVDAQAAAKVNESETQEDVDDISVADIEEIIANVDAQLAVLRRELDAYQTAERARDGAADKTRLAAEHHASAQAWVKMKADVGPGGIPAELLSQALGPVNDRLRATAEASQWDQVMIADDMTITVGGRIYALCSESARWRADAALHEAIAALGNVEILVLDRIDVLDLANRVKLIRWLSHLAGDRAWADGGTIFALGTFKSPPVLPEDIFAVHWIERGELTTQQQKIEETA